MTDIIEEAKQAYELLIEEDKPFAASVVRRLAAELEKERNASGQLIDERDDAEEAIGQAYYLVTGRSPEWSNNFHYEQANEDIADAVSALKLHAKQLATELATAREVVDKSRAYIEARVVFDSDVDARSQEAETSCDVMQAAWDDLVYAVFPKAKAAALAAKEIK